MTQWLILPDGDQYLPLRLLKDDPQVKQLLRTIKNGPPQSLKHRWITPEVDFSPDTDDPDEWGYIVPKRAAESDCTSIETLLAFSKKAIEYLQPLIKDSVEVLPLDSVQGDYGLINILNGIDFAACLDSEIPPQYDPISGDIITPRLCVFKEDCLEGKHLFRFKWENGKWSKPFMSETLKQTIEDNRFTGFVFYKQWN